MGSTSERFLTAEAIIKERVFVEMGGLREMEGKDREGAKREFKERVGVFWGA